MDSHLDIAAAAAVSHSIDEKGIEELKPDVEKSGTVLYSSTSNDDDVHDEINESVEQFFSSFKETPIKVSRRGDNETLDVLSGIYLSIFYPLTKCMAKNIIVGVFEALGYLPGVLINHYGKHVLFTMDTWMHFINNVNDFEKHLLEKVSGKKTRIRIKDSDIEVDNLKIYGKQYIRLKDFSQHDEKVLLTTDEFYVLNGVSHAINRYLQQLSLNGSYVQKYLIDVIHNNPSVEPVYDDIDSSILNRLPQEVTSHRYVKQFAELLGELSYNQLEQVE